MVDTILVFAFIVLLAVCLRVRVSFSKGFRNS